MTSQQIEDLKAELRDQLRSAGIPDERYDLALCLLACEYDQDAVRHRADCPGCKRDAEALGIEAE